MKKEMRKNNIMKKKIKVYLVSLSLISPVVIATPLFLSRTTNHNIINTSSDNLISKSSVYKPTTNKKYQTGLTIPNNIDIEYGKLFDESKFKGKKLNDINFQLIKESVINQDKVQILDYRNLNKNNEINAFTFSFTFNERPGLGTFQQTIYLGLEQLNKRQVSLEQFANSFKLHEEKEINKNLYLDTFASSEGIMFFGSDFTQSALVSKNLLKSIVGVIDIRWIEECGLIQGYPNFNLKEITKKKGKGLIYKYSLYKQGDKMSDEPMMTVQISNNVNISSFKLNGKDYFEILVPKGSVTIKSQRAYVYGSKKEYKNDKDFWFYLKDIKGLYN